MLISLDFDGVVTADQKHWLRWIALARIDGHTVITVTSRKDTYANRREIEDVLGATHEVIFAFDKPKKLAAIEAGHQVDIFIDDHPEVVGDGTENVATQSVFEIELRHAWRVLCDGIGYDSAMIALRKRIETVLGD